MFEKRNDLRPLSWVAPESACEVWKIFTESLQLAQRSHIKNKENFLHARLKSMSVEELLALAQSRQDLQISEPEIFMQGYEWLIDHGKLAIEKDNLIKEDDKEDRPTPLLGKAQLHRWTIDHWEVDTKNRLLRWNTRIKENAHQLILRHHSVPPGLAIKYAQAVWPVENIKKGRHELLARGQSEYFQIKIKTEQFKSSDNSWSASTDIQRSEWRSYKSTLRPLLLQVQASTTLWFLAEKIEATPWSTKEGKRMMKLELRGKW